MRKYLYLLIGLMAVVGCSTDDIELYDSNGYISFVNKESDTVVV